MHECPECGQACYCNGDIEDHQNTQCEDDCVHDCNPDHDEEGWDDPPEATDD